MLVRLSLGRSSLIAWAAQSVGTCDLVPKKAGRISSNRLLQLAEVKRLPRAKNEIWYQRIPDPQQRPEGDQGS